MNSSIKIRIVSYGLLSIFSLATCYPLLWMLFGSLKNNGEFYSNLWSFPKQWEWGNYLAAWKTSQFSVTFTNSVIVTGASIVLVVIISYLASYALARCSFMGNRLIMILLLSTLMIPSQVTFIPLYQVELFLGIYNTLWGLILPYVAGSMPLAIFLMSTFIRSIPRELDEAARIDGCSEWGILWKIMFPLTKPALATVVILTFIHVWNEFFLALIMIQDPSLRTIPVGMTYFNQVFEQTNYTQLFAAMGLNIIPVIVIYVFFQKYFISGLTQGAVKM